MDYYGNLLERDVSIAKASGATLLPVTPWFCYRLACSPVVGNYIVYIDRDHLSIQYSQYLSGVMYSTLGRILAESSNS
jgi:hypothetical protein